MPDRIAEQPGPRPDYAAILDSLCVAVSTLSRDALGKLHAVSVLDEEQHRDLNHARNDLETLLVAAGRARRKAGLE